MSFKTVSGEGNACTNEMVSPWEQTTLPTILSKYELNQIYNANEFGLFYHDGGPDDVVSVHQTVFEEDGIQIPLIRTFATSGTYFDKELHESFNFLKIFFR